jgi:hypothetical protein
VLSIIALWRAVRLFRRGGLVAFVFELNLLALEPTVRKSGQCVGDGALNCLKIPQCKTWIRSAMLPTVPSSLAPIITLGEASILPYPLA